MAENTETNWFPTILVERTLAVIKPDAVDKSDEIEDIILKSGFIILQVSLIHTFMESEA